MTKAEFLVESLNFLPGKIVVMSSPDLDALDELLQDAKDAIIDLTENSAIVVGSRDELQYLSDDEGRGVMFEHVVVSNPESVILVPNVFDINDPKTNYMQRSLHIDVVYDLIEKDTVKTIPLANSRLYIGTRGIFGYISKIYYFDGDDTVDFIKNMNSFR